MMIVGKDNLARETVRDSLLIAGIPDTAENEHMSQSFCDWLNGFTAHDNGGIYYSVQKNDYKLWRGMEELV